MRCIACLLLCITASAFADTIGNYMNIANNIPKMEIQADPQAQAWARSARNILTLTGDTISDTLKVANEAMQAQGNPLFCLPNGESLTPETVNKVIQETYREISSQQSSGDQMTVSQVALIGIKKRFPCSDSTPKNTVQMQHANAF